MLEFLIPIISQLSWYKAPQSLFSLLRPLYYAFGRSLQRIIGSTRTEQDSDKSRIRTFGGNFVLTGLALGPRTSGGGPQLVWAQLLSCLKPETLLRLRPSVLFSSPQGCHTSSRRASLLVPLSASRTLATCLGFGAYLRTSQDRDPV